MRNKVQYIRTKSRTEWEELRKSLMLKGMVGGSDCGTIMGLNQYKSRLKLFYQAVGYEPVLSIDNEVMFHGRNLEDYVAKLWNYWDGSTETLLLNYSTNTKVQRAVAVKATVINPKYPFLFANIDRKITKHRERKGVGVLEIKTISSYHAEQYQGGIPPTYLLQLQLYMIVMGVQYGEIASLKDGRVFESVSFDRHQSLQDKILGAAEDFYNRVAMGREMVATIKNDEELIHALSEIEPDIEPTLAYEDYLTERHKRRLTEKSIDGDQRLRELAGGYSTALAECKQAEAKKLAITNEIKKTMEANSASVVSFGDEGSITWRHQMRVNYKPRTEDASELNF